MKSDENKWIRDGWNELGFHYSLDHQNRCWLIVGSKEGILRFCDFLEGYAIDESREAISSDAHYGPYSYLKFVTWTEPIIAQREICGRMSDFDRLSAIIKDKLKKSNGEFTVDKEFSDKNEYILKILVKEDDFEPASLDENLK